MKKLLLAVLMVLVMAGVCFAGDKVGSTADAAITSGQGYLRSIIAHTDGTNSVTFAVYDNASAASGSKLFSTMTVTTSASNRCTTIEFQPEEAQYYNGIYVDITTSGTGGDNLDIVLTPAGTGVVKTKSIEPITDDTYYLGKNDDDSPAAFKGLILKDTANGKYYRIEITNGSIVATDLTD